MYVVLFPGTKVHILQLPMSYGSRHHHLLARMQMKGVGAGPMKVGSGNFWAPLCILNVPIQGGNNMLCYYVGSDFGSF